MRALAILVMGAMAAAPAAAGGGAIAIKARAVHTGTGEVIAPAVIAIRDGRITGVFPGTEVPAGFEAVDASDLVVIPGLVDASATIDDGADDRRSIAPEILAYDGIDPTSDGRRWLRAGVTTLGVTPGSRRLLSGQGAVVRTGGAREGRVLARSFGLRVTIGDAPKNPPGIFDAPVPPSSENPLKPMERQYPSTRMGQFGALRKALESARGGGDDVETSIAEAASGRRPLLVAAHTLDDIVKVVRFADEMKLSVVLLDGEEAAGAADLLAGSQIPVVFAAPPAPGGGSGASESKPWEDLRHTIAGASALVKAGVKVALHAPSERDAEDLLLLAAWAVRHGVPEKEALRLVTLAPAQILGVGDRIGSIEPGKEADLVFLDGDPLSGAAKVRRVLIAGETAFERRPEDDATYDALGADAGRTDSRKPRLALTGARLLTVTQGVLADGLIIIEDGKLAYVGRSRPVEAGTKIVDLKGMTISPGLIDLHTTLGLGQDRREDPNRRPGEPGAVPSGNANPISDYVRLDDPACARAASAGVTTVLVAPQGGGVCSLLKLGPRAEVVRAVAAMKMTVGGGTAAFEQAKGQIERAKKYHEQWEAYEKAPKQAPPPSAPTGPAAAEDPISGTWEGTIEVTGMGPAQNFTAQLTLSGTEVTGTLKGPTGPEQAVKGAYANGELKIDMEQQGVRIVMTLKVGKDEMSGSMEVHVQGRRMEGKVEARRTAKAGTGSVPAPGPTPGAPAGSAPKKDDNLEPWRPVFRSEIPVIVVARDIPAIDNATKLLGEEFKVPYVLLGADEGDHLSATLSRRSAAVALLPTFLRDMRGARANLAEALASAGVPVAFTSGGTGSPADLPLTVVQGVRHGMDRFDALKAVTIHPARMLLADGLVGALERGRDADLVVTEGDPFDLSARVMRVYARGKLVFERK